MADELTLPILGAKARAQIVYLAGGINTPPSTGYSLANNVASLAAGSATTPVSGIVGGSYVWAYQMTGSSNSLVLEALGPDGTNYQAIGSPVTGSGTLGVVLGNNSTVRLRNAGSSAITNLYSNLT